MRWARLNGHIIFTHDLDFSQILAHTQSCGPSVLQVRAQDVTPEALDDRVISCVVQFGRELSDGAIVTLDEHSSRVRVLPLR